MNSLLFILGNPGEFVILLVEGCSLIQYAMECNMIPLSEFASFRHLFKYSEDSAGLYSNQISLIITPPAGEENKLITVYLESKPACLDFVNHCTRSWTSYFVCLVFSTPRGDDKSVHITQCCRIIGLQLDYTCQSLLHLGKACVTYLAYVMV